MNMEKTGNVLLYHTCEPELIGRFKDYLLNRQAFDEIDFKGIGLFVSV